MINVTDHLGLDQDQDLHYVNPQDYIDEYEEETPVHGDLPDDSLNDELPEESSNYKDPHQDYIKEYYIERNPETEEIQFLEGYGEEVLPSEVDDEAEIFLGEDPSKNKKDCLNIRQDLVERINVWLKSGLSKEERTKLWTLNNRSGNINLEAPLLNQNFQVSYDPKIQNRDEHMRGHQNSVGSILAANVRVFDYFLNNKEQAYDREFVLRKISEAVKLSADLFWQLTLARKIFAMGAYNSGVKKVLKEVEPTKYLFGDDMNAVINSVESTVKSDTKARQKNFSNNFTLKPSGRSTQFNLNWRGSSRGGRESFRPSYQRFQTSRRISQRQYPYPAKRVYTQSQPQRTRQ